MLATLVRPNNRLETWRRLSTKTLQGLRWKQHERHLSNLRSERQNDSRHHSSHHFHCLTRVHASTAYQPLMTREGLVAPLNRLESTARNVDATIRGASSEGVIVETIPCTTRPNSTSTAERKKKAAVMIEVAAAAYGVDDENVSSSPLSPPSSY